MKFWQIGSLGNQNVVAHGITSGSIKSGSRND